ncbi:TetR/AcrR family transcriptional regulator [Glaciibacter psychrotolerans]|uniref:AcrR family transcriptional regulator n=1 Tax=Glaciibacter psychrotolerans TaxID=670054 RepID=A0A7Z0EGC3_9MICO|nr:TetR/AcrR family transcriptional regulator [Leifsonia psychrotolerans]NYJ20710.1 AcrR family transcriptional regulator [Leifsonia psychrotolerans]
MNAASAKSAETRERILGVASVEFAERGYAGTSIGTIAEKSGAGKGLVQYHFKAKSDIAVAIVRGAFSKAPFANPLDGGAEARGVAAIVASIRGVSGAFRDDVRVRAAVRLVREYDVIPVTFPTPYVGWMARMAELLREAVDDGEIPPLSDYDVEGWHLVATFTGVQETSQRLTGRHDLPERIEQMMALQLPRLGVRDLERYLGA